MAGSIILNAKSPGGLTESGSLADPSAAGRYTAPFSQARTVSVMQLIRGQHNLRSHHRGCAVTIGAFDGVHLGHQAVLEHLKKQALLLGIPTTVVTFEPLPREYLTPLEAPPRITTSARQVATARGLWR